jgi:hypothetical protein
LIEFVIRELAQHVFLLSRRRGPSPRNSWVEGIGVVVLRRCDLDHADRRYQADLVGPFGGCSSLAFTSP